MKLGGTANEPFDIISHKVLIGSLALNIGIEAKGLTVVPEKRLTAEVFHLSTIRRCFLEDLIY
jgi:hypothetical protein